MTDPTPEPTPSMLLAAVNRIFDRVDSIESEIRQLRTETNQLRTETNTHFVDLYRQNTHTAQLITATSGDVTTVARQLIDHLNRHAA